MRQGSADKFEAGLFEPFGPVEPASRGEPETKDEDMAAQEVPTRPFTPGT